MENQAPDSRAHVSECDLPEIPPATVFAATYVVSDPAADITDELVAQAAALIADAGLPAMAVSSCVSRYSDGRKAYQVMATDRDPVRNTFAFASAHGLAPSAEETLARFSANLATWARGEGLLPAVQTMEGSPAL